MNGSCTTPWSGMPPCSSGPTKCSKPGGSSTPTCRRGRSQAAHCTPTRLGPGGLIWRRYWWNDRATPGVTRRSTSNSPEAEWPDFRNDGRPIAMIGGVQVVDSVADAFATLVSDVLARPRRGGFSLFLSGGSTAGEAYQRLAHRSAKTVDWASVDSYWSDERCVPIDHADSNYRLGRQNLLDLVGPLRSDHPMYRSGTPADAAADYQHQLSELSSFDLVHLGMGPDRSEEHTSELQ